MRATQEKNLTTANNAIEDLSKQFCADAKKQGSEKLNEQQSIEQIKLAERGSTLRALVGGAFNARRALKNTETLHKIEVKTLPTTEKLIREQVLTQWPVDKDGNDLLSTPLIASAQTESHPTSSDS